MHTYLSSFDSHIRGFTGTPEQIAKMAKEYRIDYQKVSTSVFRGSRIHHYSMSADGQFDTVIPYREKDATALAKLRTLVASVPPS